MKLNQELQKIMSPEANMIYVLQPGDISNDVYDRLKPIMEFYQGHWRERFKGFVFNENVMDKINYALTHENVEKSIEKSWREDMQFFPTPAPVAKRVAELCNVTENDVVMEPSAGEGALIDEITSAKYKFLIEPYAPNAQTLREKGYEVWENTFEEMDSKARELKITKIIMNPPFSGQRDIKHFMLAYDVLEEGGTIVSVLSENALYYDTEVSRNFRDFLEEKDAYIEPVPFQAFKESGTTIDTIIIKVVK